MWKGVIGVEVVVATVLALPLVKEPGDLVAEEALAVIAVAEVAAVVGGWLALGVAVVTVAVVVAVEIGACVLAGEGRMGRP